MPFSPSSASGIDGEALLRIVRLVERFEDSWRQGEPIPLEELVRGVVENERVALLEQALGVELDYRRLRGESPTLEEYERRFPDYVATLRTVFDLWTSRPSTPTDANKSRDHTTEGNPPKAHA